MFVQLIGPMPNPIRLLLYTVSADHSFMLQYPSKSKAALRRSMCPIHAICIPDVLNLLKMIFGLEVQHGHGCGCIAPVNERKSTASLSYIQCCTSCLNCSVAQQSWLLVENRCSRLLLL